jgi:flavin reductase (DIM6/NTAB) family NADH-FMN oxidoreductase RutF
VDVGEPVSVESFDRLVRTLDYPMYVVTCVSHGRRAGCLVGFTSQVSIDPRRFLIGLSNKNYTCRVAASADRLAVHLLPAGARALASLFGENSGDSVDKFASCQWHSGPDGVPILDDAIAWFTGKVLLRTNLGDHVGHLIEPDAGQCRDDLGDMLTFADVSDMDAGHDP